MTVSPSPTRVNGLRLRKILGREDWLPPRRFGPDGWQIVRRDGSVSVIVTAFDDDDGVEWIHASIARHDDTMPTYDDLVLLHRATFGEHRWSYQVFAPSTDHVNLHEHALHLWGRVDGSPVMPNFGQRGSI